MIDLTNIELFKSLVSLELDGDIIDLHNDYDCISLQYHNAARLLEIFFESSNSKVCLHFEQATIIKFNVMLKKTKDACVLDNFYRGRFEFDGTLVDRSPLGERYYYIEFEEGDLFEIIAQKATLLRQS